MAKPVECGVETRFVVTMSTDDLHRDIEELRAELRQRDRLILGLQRQVARLLDEVAKRPAADKKKSRKKGKKSKSKSKPPPGEAPKAPPRDEDTTEKKAKGVPKRKPPPGHFERITEHHPARPTPCCQTPDLRRREDKVIEQLDFHPATVDVRRIELEQWLCECCGANHRAPMPPVAVPNGSMTARMLALVAYNKCALHLPSVRTSVHLATLGVELASSTMCNAMGHVAKLVDCIYDRMVARLFASPVLMMDGTGMKVLQPGETGTHRGQFVVYCNEELTVYDYNPSKHAHYFETFLRIGEHDEFKGFVVADSASNMSCLDAEERTRCGCWQHARSNFKKARVSAPIEAEEAIAWIGTFFDVEHRADDEGDPPEHRLARRKQEMVPLMTGFDRWAVVTEDKFDPDEDLSKAIRYLTNHRTALRRCLSDGRIPLTNNLAERELGVIGRGRRGYLFAGSDASGEQLAKLYTIIRTCQRMAVAPWDYLAWVLPQLSDLPVNRGKGHLDSLTPWAYRDMVPAI